ncbi:hypothetical protein K457DRAFT_26120 [Linnemannia elongata AG-77]|uniref:Crinkler effector protein N-terminal domain-containing protein n=1 Tax=Linnemannia elongata AG-77 TaxID=1314771 RepID=A0A197JD63_9FUNG|nr:hypothetical protein K457DRAFT_26120 [Linnemannia elongata AG-77]
MTKNPLTLFCLVDGEATSNAFSVKIPSSDTDLTLWRVSISDDDDNDLPVLLSSVPEKKKLNATAKFSKVFGIAVPEDTIHVIVQRPPQGDLRADTKKSRNDSL